ncbi:MAG TPA: hypothetical protein DEH15_18505 [Marinilabiliales bacterium]|nr:hypothetical protein [Marinilabiliales bacterium]
MPLKNELYDIGFSQNDYFSCIPPIIHLRSVCKHHEGLLRKRFKQFLSVLVKKQKANSNLLTIFRVYCYS